MGNIIRTAACFVVCLSCSQRCAHKYMYEQFLNLYSLIIGSVFVLFLQRFFLYFCVSFDQFGFVLLVLVGFSFSSTEPRDWLGRASPK